MAPTGPEPAVRRQAAGTILTAAQARDRGLSEGQLRSQAAVRLFHGVYGVDVDPTDLTVRARAALLAAGPGCLVCEATALRLHGVALPHRFMSDDSIHLLARPGGPGVDIKGIRIHRATTPLTASTEADPPLVDPVDCWLQLAGRATTEELIMVADAIMPRGHPLTTPEALAVAVEARPGGRGIRAARAAVTQARAGTQSPMETRVRLQLVAAGLPCPLVGYSLSDPTGVTHRLDMAFPDQRVAVEYGGVAQVDRLQLEQMTTRRRQIEDLGWRLISVTRADVRAPEPYIGSVRQALAARETRGQTPCLTN